MKHKTLPVFIPHLGCPNQCTFCNQHAITHTHVPTPEEVKAQLRKLASTLTLGQVAEIAFFGGSFTALPRVQMIAYLAAAREVAPWEIRISTRPDAIDEEILSILTYYGVKTIELGIQSTDDSVLARCKRGHTALQSAHACAKILHHGFTLGGQMMIGLPGANRENECHTARKICDWGASQCRIYPLAVFAHTPLATELADGRFSPLSLEGAIERSTDALEIFSAHGVKVLRIGLCETDSLASELVGGIYHPAFGELVYGELFYRRLRRLIESRQSLSPHLTISVPKGALSRAIGLNQKNRLRLSREFSLSSLRFQEDPSLVGFACQISSL